MEFRSDIINLKNFDFRLVQKSAAAMPTTAAIAVAAYWLTARSVLSSTTCVSSAEPKPAPVIGVVVYAPCE